MIRGETFLKFALLVIPQSLIINLSPHKIFHIFQPRMKLRLSFFFLFVGGNQFICHLRLACGIKAGSVCFDRLPE